jgi:hypothetical protein
MQTFETAQRIMLKKDDGQHQYYLDGRALHEGDILEAYFDRSGWVPGRYYWSGRIEFTPRLDPINPTQDRVHSRLRGFNLGTACRWPTQQPAVNRTVNWNKHFETSGSLLIAGEIEGHAMEVRGPYQGAWRVTVGTQASRSTRSLRPWPSFEVRGTLETAQRAAIEAVLYSPPRA